MGILIITLILTIIGIGLIVVYKKTRADEWVEVTGWATTLVAGLTVITMIVLALLVPLQAESKIADYEALRYTIQDARNINQEIDLERAGILKDIIENNRVIERNKKLSQNFWVGIWYSEEVGRLTPIKR